MSSDAQKTTDLDSLDELLNALDDTMTSVPVVDDNSDSGFLSEELDVPISSYGNSFNASSSSMVGKLHENRETSDEIDSSENWFGTSFYVESK